MGREGRAHFQDMVLAFLYSCKEVVDGLSLKCLGFEDAAMVEMSVAGRMSSDGVKMVTAVIWFVLYGAGARVKIRLYLFSCFTCWLNHVINDIILVVPVVCCLRGEAERSGNSPG